MMLETLRSLRQFRPIEVNGSKRRRGRAASVHDGAASLSGTCRAASSTTSTAGPTRAASVGRTCSASAPVARRASTR